MRAVMTETIIPPTMMLMATIATGPNLAIEAGLKLGFVKVCDALREHGSPILHRAARCE
jgi:hypothetical protein